MKKFKPNKLNVKKLKRRRLTPREVLDKRRREHSISIFEVETLWA
jgi:hypothetical protein